MILAPTLRKLVVTAHVASSVGWLGALAVFFAHAVASLLSRDPQVVDALSQSMGLTAWVVILPLCLSALATGLVAALGSGWGLFRHYWVLFKLLLTAGATMVLLLKLAPISYLARASTALHSASDLQDLRMSLTMHAAGGLVILVAALALAVFKPKGMTRYGLSRQRASVDEGMASVYETGGAMPAWVKGFVLIIILLLCLGALLLIGGHGPGAHMPHH